jgi:hypothetical protein
MKHVGDAIDRLPVLDIGGQLRPRYMRGGRWFR